MEDVKTGSLSAWVEGEWPWLGISIGGWTALWFLAPLLRSVLGISDRSPDTNLYINVLILSTIHSVFAVALAILCTIDPSMAADRVYGQSPLGRATGIFEIGFFVLDVYVCVRFFKEYGMAAAVHGFVVLTILLSTMINRVFWWYMFTALLYEFSTIFMNVRLFLIRTKQTSAPWWPFWNWGFLSTFVLMRVVFGTCLTYITVSAVVNAVTAPMVARVIAGGSSFLSWCLNMQWALQGFLSQTRKRRTVTHVKKGA